MGEARAALAFAGLLLAGCLTPAADIEPQAEALPERAVREPVPKPATEPPLPPEAGLREEPWGYVWPGWEPPPVPRPVILSMDGYQGANYVARPSHYLRVRDGVLLGLTIVDGATLGASEEYLYAFGSIRGTGCSGGAFQLFDRTHALDGREVVEWLAAQPWSTGKVGLFGASYSGITALEIASTRPPHLAAVSGNLVLADTYRDITYPGGVPNVGFPVAWTLAVRPAEEALGVANALKTRDLYCALLIATRPAPRPTDNPTVGFLTRATDDDWYRMTSLDTYARDIEVPTLITVAWQDEQVGSRGGPALFEALHPAEVQHRGAMVEPKMLVATNGLHGTGGLLAKHVSAGWFDAWLRGVDNGILDEPPVLLVFNTDTDLWPPADPVAPFLSPVGEVRPLPPNVLRLDAFPSQSTAWSRWYARANGLLAPEPPSSDEPSDAYVAGSPRASWLSPAPAIAMPSHDLPDALAYTSEPLVLPMVMAGPLAATLFVATTATDADLFVVLADVAPDGRTTDLARGMLRASHRALDPDRTQRTAQGDIYRPYHPHTNPTPVVPGQLEQYEVEVFPAAHIFHAGHRVQLRVTTPPPADGFWSYAGPRAPAVHTLAHDAQHPSGVLLPLVEWAGPLPDEPPCGAPDGYRCTS